MAPAAALLAVMLVHGNTWIELEPCGFRPAEPPYDQGMSVGDSPNLERIVIRISRIDALIKVRVRNAEHHCTMVYFAGRRQFVHGHYRAIKRALDIEGEP